MYDDSCHDLDQLPIHIEYSDAPFESTDYEKFEYTEDTHRLFSKHDLDKNSFIIKLEADGMVLSDAFDIFDSFTISCLQGNMNICICKSDFDGIVCGSVCSFQIEKGQSVLVHKDPFNHIYIPCPENMEEACYLLVKQMEVPMKNFDCGEIINSSIIENMNNLIETFCEDSYLRISDFLNKDFLSSVKNEIQEHKNDLVPVGPLNVRQFKWMSTPSTTIQSMINMLESDDFKRFLSEITSLEIGKIVVPPRCILLEPGSMRIMHDNYVEPNGIDLFIALSDEFNNSEEVKWVYVSNEDGEVIEEFQFKENVLNVVYRSEGCSRFIPYVSKLSKGKCLMLTVTFEAS